MSHISGWQESQESQEKGNGKQHRGLRDERISEKCSNKQPPLSRARINSIHFCQIPIKDLITGIITDSIMGQLVLQQANHPS
ncbi:hypothetical protein EOD39_12301 [Acipenser ruthenus]|uniref:Uncharacterized protein n=1 Tax=Acipenser ruthenus TaxID=7906 RepID=A0A662YR01_ACIRT|nr:hypothetical protein EOD39_12301 [Acipenser ruthenus]